MMMEAPKSFHCHSFHCLRTSSMCERWTWVAVLLDCSLEDDIETIYIRRVYWDRESKQSFESELTLRSNNPALKRCNFLGCVFGSNRRSPTPFFVKSKTETIRISFVVVIILFFLRFERVCDTRFSILHPLFEVCFHLLILHAIRRGVD